MYNMLGSWCINARGDLNCLFNPKHILTAYLIIPILKGVSHNYTGSPSKHLASNPPTDQLTNQY